MFLLESSDPLLLRNVFWLFEFWLFELPLLLFDEFDLKTDWLLPPLERVEPPDRSLPERPPPPPSLPPPPLLPLPSRSASAAPVETSSATRVATADVRIKVVTRMI